MNRPYPVKDAAIQDKDIADQIQLVAHMRKTPLMLYGILLEITRQFYSDANDLPIGVAATWNEDAAKSKLWIDTDYKWEDDHPETRPAIYIKLAPITYRSVTGRPGSEISVDLQEGETRHERIGASSAQWVHIGRTRGESIVLSGSTLDYLDGLGTVIRDDFCFLTWQLVGWQSLTVDKESQERYRSIVTVNFTWQDTWAIKMESPKLKRIVLNAGRGLYGGLFTEP